MRNLKLVDSRHVVETEALRDAQLISLDTEQNNIYVASSSHVVCYSFDGKEIASVPVQDSESDQSCLPIGLQYLGDQQALCLATDDGRICLWHLSNPEELECVGDVESGITAMGWSPDLELIVITTGENKLLLMTREFDVISEVGLFPDHEGEDGHITVGWGKKETQFHGSSGKQAAKQEHIVLHSTSEHDDGNPLISWRGDGQFFVISSIEPNTGARFLYTWSRECVFQARSEPVDGVQNCLSWKPSGSLITSVQKAHSSLATQVIFYEKNGLRHGEFNIQTVTTADVRVQFISWNQDSSVLAVCLEYTENDSKSSLLQLWTVNNYHWYLKQSLHFSSGVSMATWDPEQTYKMHVLSRSGTYSTFVWAWHTDCTPGRIDEDDALVAVIDGKQLLVTPIRKMVVPPPMSAYAITLPYPVRNVTFKTDSSGTSLAIYMANDQIAVFNCQGEGNNTSLVSYTGAGGGDGFVPQCKLPHLEDMYHIKFQTPEDQPSQIVHFLWISESQFLFTKSGQSCSILHRADICKGEKALVVRTSIELNNFVLSMAKNEETNTVAIELVNGEVFKLLPDKEDVQPWLSPSSQPVRFPYPCTEMSVTSFGQQEIVIGRTDRFRLFVNNTEIASNCTSFKVHNEFLLLTTFSHTIRCISRACQLNDLSSLSDTKSHPFDESIRRVERGSQIINIVANSTKVILQMPRGNLETIHPRALVLSSLKHLMDSDKMLEAFLMMRTHRINLNLLHDHNPSHFLSHIDQFIQQVDSPAHLNVLLNDLMEEDVTQTMYTSSYSTKPDSTDTQTVGLQKSKVNRICDCFLDGLQKAGSDRFYQSILTAHVRKNPPDLEKALYVVWSLYGRDKSEKCASPEDALKYLLFLVDVNDLYNVALGMYNFDLVLMVAGKSQKDPKEYIPFLNQLRTLEENYRHYTIDKHLKKYSKALEHLVKCGDEHFQELLTLVSDHKLHAKALSLYKPGSAQFKSIAAMYGSYLRTKNRHDEAGIMFIKAEEWELALEAFQSARNWRQVFCMAGHLNYCSSTRSELAIKISGELKSSQMYKEAATVLEEYAQDPEEAIVALIQGSHWEESLRLMHRYKRLDLIETHLKEALEESWDHLMEMLSSQKAQFLQYKNRLTVVRAQKEKERSELDGGEWNETGADLFSDTSSITGATVTSFATSNSSRSTVLSKTGSARTRRKAENKKWSLKEGSKNEGFALVDALAKQMTVIYNMKDEVSSLMKMLIQFNYDQKATRLHEVYDEFLTLIDGSVGQIWNQSQTNKTAMMVGPNSTSSSLAKAVQSGQKVTDVEETLDPVLLAPPNLNKDSRWKLHIASKS
ncbi:elongator complex protein 1 [Biomphalaria glabrata]|nr:putative elongator complex protein 1 [Biomphalaria glabrata]